MAKVSFTICSNNYLAQAKALGDSLLIHNPDYRFIICLVDKLSVEIDYSYFKPYEILPVEDVPIGDFESMVLKYDITELNTAVKPFIFKYLFDRSPETNNVTYFDPDIIVYSSFDEIEKAYKDNTFIITPHITSAINDNFQLSEESFLNCGLYNLGFFGLNRTGQVFEFLDWWMERLKDRCFNNLAKGWFVDQIWINFVPLYYDGAFILRHPGYNVAYWNLHERILTTQNNTYYVNKNFPLVFYHFSGYNAFKPNGISKYQNRFTFESRPDLILLFSDYTKKVLQNNHERFSKIPCYYIEFRKQAMNEGKMQGNGTIRKKENFKRKVKSKLRSILHLNN